MNNDSQIMIGRYTRRENAERFLLVFKNCLKKTIYRQCKPLLLRYNSLLVHYNFLLSYSSNLFP